MQSLGSRYCLGDVGNRCLVVAPKPICPACNEREKLTEGIDYSLQFQSIDMETGEVGVPRPGGLVRRKGCTPPDREASAIKTRSWLGGQKGRPTDK